MSQITSVVISQRIVTFNRRRSGRLIRASLRAFLPHLLSPVIPRLILALATFAQPLLVNQTLAFVADQERTVSTGWALFGGFVCVYTILPLSTSLYWEAVSRAGSPQHPRMPNNVQVLNTVIEYRGALIGAIYTKTLGIDLASSRSLGSGVAGTYMYVTHFISNSLC